MRPAALPEWMRAWRYPQDAAAGARAVGGPVLGVAEPPYREASGG